MSRAVQLIPDLLPRITPADRIASRGRRAEARERAEQRARFRRVLWRALSGRVDRAYDPKLLAE